MRAIWRLGAMGILAVAVAGAGIGVTATAEQGRGIEHPGESPYAIGLWGDVPYSTLQATVGVPNLIADMNAQHLAFSVHDGDLKTGNGIPTCADALYTNARDTLNTLDAPAMFTPGDNDWTDCDRPNNGGFNSLERLTVERSIMFSTPFSFGKHTLQQEVQTAPMCLGVDGEGSTTKVATACVENRRWVVGHVVYATFNVQGSCNNLCGDAPDSLEWTARNQADIAWLHETFEEARALKTSAVMIISQADPGFGLIEIDGPARDPQTLAQTDPPDGFQEFLLALRDEVVAFKLPVAYVHGGSVPSSGGN